MASVFSSRSGSSASGDRAGQQLLVLGVHPFDVRLVRLVGEQDVLADGRGTRARMRSTRGRKSSWKIRTSSSAWRHGVDQVLGGQAGVDGVEDGADAGDAKVHLQVAVAVPLDDADPGARLDPQGLQGSPRRSTRWYMAL